MPALAFRSGRAEEAAAHPQHAHNMSFDFNRIRGIGFVIPEYEFGISSCNGAANFNASVRCCRHVANTSDGDFERVARGLEPKVIA